MILTSSSTTPVVQNGTLTFPYPSGKTAASFVIGSSKLYVEGIGANLSEAADQFDVVLGVSNVTVTYKHETPIPANAAVRLDLTLRADVANPIDNEDISAAWGGPAYSNAFVRRAAPSAKLYLAADFDDQGRLTRTYDQASGRMDLYGVNSNGAAMVVALNKATTPADGDNLGHYAYRGKDSNLNYNTFAYVLATAETVSATGANLDSSLYFGVMKDQTAGAGNAQPNWGMTLSGKDSALKFTGDITFSFGGVDALAATSTGLATKLPTKLAQEQYSNKTSNYAIAAADAGTVFTNILASGQVDFTLPTGVGSGTRFTFVVQANQTLKIIAPASTIIRVGPSVTSAAGNLTSSQVGASIELLYFASSLQWVARSVTGTGGSSGAGGWTAA